MDGASDEVQNLNDLSLHYDINSYVDKSRFKMLASELMQLASAQKLV